MPTFAESPVLLVVLATAPVKLGVEEGERPTATSELFADDIDVGVALATTMVEYDAELTLPAPVTTTPLLPALSTSPPGSVTGSPPTVAVFPPTTTSVAWALVDWMAVNVVAPRVKTAPISGAGPAPEPAPGGSGLLLDRTSPSPPRDNIAPPVVRA